MFPDQLVASRMTRLAVLGSRAAVGSSSRSILDRSITAMTSVRACRCRPKTFPWVDPTLRSNPSPISSTVCSTFPERLIGSDAETSLAVCAVPRGESSPIKGAPARCRQWILENPRDPTRALMIGQVGDIGAVEEYPPLWGCTVPAMQLSRVDLPEPFVPMTAVMNCAGYDQLNAVERVFVRPVRTGNCSEYVKPDHRAVLSLGSAMTISTNTGDHELQPERVNAHAGANASSSRKTRLPAITEANCQPILLRMPPRSKLSPIITAPGPGSRSRCPC